MFITESIFNGYKSIGIGPSMKGGSSPGLSSLAFSWIRWMTGSVFYFMEVMTPGCTMRKQVSGGSMKVWENLGPLIQIQCTLVFNIYFSVIEDTEKPFMTILFYDSVILRCN